MPLERALDGAPRRGDRLSLASALREGLNALRLEDTAEATQQQLLDYLGLLLKWNRHYNLTAVREPGAMLAQHLLDCLAVLGPLDRRLAHRPDARLLDVGSGAGLPGVVLAIMRPRWSVCCVDAVAKKAGFVRQVSGELGLHNLRGEHARVEQLQESGFDVVTSRAFASLGDFVTLTTARLAPAGCWMAMKGRRPDDEIRNLPESVELFHVEPLTVPGLDARRCLVWMRPRAA